VFICKMSYRTENDKDTKAYEISFHSLHARFICNYYQYCVTLTGNTLAGMKPSENIACLKVIAV
jgi:hypothetical protein